MRLARLAIRARTWLCAASKWLAASCHAIRGWWWLGWECELWLSPRAAWTYAHQNHDYEQHFREARNGHEAHEAGGDALDLRHVRRPPHEHGPT